MNTLIDDAIDFQEHWMKTCGTDLEGYVQHFGPKGKEIYIADLTEMVWLVNYAGGLNKPDWKVVNAMVRRVVNVYLDGG